MNPSVTSSRRRVGAIRFCGVASGLALAFGSVPRARAQHGARTEAPEQPPTEFSGVMSGGVVATDPVPSAYDDAERERRARERAAQRNFALVALAMPYDGFGLGIRALGPRLGLDLSGAFRPVLATYSTDPGKFPKIRVLSGFQLNAGFYLGVYRPNLRTDLGLAAAYKYHTLLGHGVSAAFYLKRELSAHFSFQLFIGPAVFPHAERAIRAKTNWSGGSVSSGIAWHQGGLGVSLAFYP